MGRTGACVELQWWCGPRGGGARHGTVSPNTPKARESGVVEMTERTPQACWGPHSSLVRRPRGRASAFTVAGIAAEYATIDRPPAP